MEAGLKVAGGKCILNSTNLRTDMAMSASSRYWRLAKRYGAAVVVGTLMKVGTGAGTAGRQFAIAQRAIATPLNSHFLPRNFLRPLACRSPPVSREGPGQWAATDRGDSGGSGPLPAFIVVLVKHQVLVLSPATRIVHQSVYSARVLQRRS